MTIAYRVPKSREPVIATASSRAGSTSTYGTAARSRGTTSIDTDPAAHSTSMPSGVFTSSAASEGKSTTSFAIARDFAKVGRRVLLIDADLRKPSLHRALRTAKYVADWHSPLTNQVALARFIPRWLSRAGAA